MDSMPTPEESRRAFKQFQKGKARANEVLGHASSCVKCAAATSTSTTPVTAATTTAMDPTKPPTMSCDCILYTQPTAYIPARAPRCFCPSETTPALDTTYAVLHDLFVRRLKLHDLPIVFYEEVAELEKTMVPEMIRDAMLGKGFMGDQQQQQQQQQQGPESSWHVGGEDPGRNARGKRRTRPFRLSEYPDAEARLEMRDELVSLVKVLGKECVSLLDTHCQRRNDDERSC